MNKTAKSIFAVFASILALYYVGYQIYIVNYEPVSTEIATELTVSDSFDTTVFVVRDEKYITKNSSGSIVPVVKDGKRVANGDEVAVVFPDERNATTFKKIKAIEESIAHYESLENKNQVITSDIDAIDHEIDQLFSQCLDVISTGKLENYKEASDELRDKISFRQLAIGIEMNFSEKIASLKSQLTDLQNSISNYASIKAPESGYYISNVDGYENVLNYDAIDSITIADIEKAIKSEKQTIESNVMGKLVNAFDWYLVCTIDNVSIADLSIGEKVKINFPFSAVSTLNTTIYKINNASGGKSALILKCNQMNDALAQLRIESAQIVVNEHSGYRIDNRAIRVEDGIKGVYILRGNLISFRKINIIYSNNTFSIVKDVNEEGGHLKLYDEVIVKGKDLYNGKIIK